MKESRLSGVGESAWSRTDCVLSAVEDRLALVGGIAAFSLMVLAVVSVGGRHMFGKPLPGYVDWIEQAMPFIAFVGIAYVQRWGGHIRMDMVVGTLRGRFLYSAELLSLLLILILMVLLTWGSWSHFERSFDWGAPLFSRDSSMDISLPLWPAKLLVPLSFGLLGLRLCHQIWGYVYLLWEGEVRVVLVERDDKDKDLEGM